MRNRVRLRLWGRVFKNRALWRQVTVAFLLVAFAGTEVLALRDLQQNGFQWNTLAVLVGMGALALATLQLVLASQVARGDLYSEPPIERVALFLPDPEKHVVKGCLLTQRRGEERQLKELPVRFGRPSEVHAWVHVEENLTFQSVYFRFADQGDQEDDTLGHGIDFLSVPKIVPRRFSAYAKHTEGPMISSHVFGWHNDYRIEYPGGRRIISGAWMPVSLRVVGRALGEFPLRVKIFVAESRKPYATTLMVRCVK